MKFLTLFIAPILIGWMTAFSMPPVSFWPCLFVGLSALYYLFAQTQNMAGAFRVGFFFALGYFTTGLWWIGNALLVEGNEFAWVWPISVIGLPTLLAFFTATYLAIARKISDPKNARGFLAFAFFLTFSEWARGNAFTGFPWNLYGYVWADHLPMAQAAHYIGAYGLTFLSILWAGMAGFLFITAHHQKFKISCGAFVTISMLLVYLGGDYRLKHTANTFDENVGIVVVQPNIPQNMKWDPVAVQENFSKYLRLSAGADFGVTKPKNIVIVWPETAISPTIYDDPKNMNRLRDVLNNYKNADAYLATGILRRYRDETGQTQYGNSVVLFDKDLNALDAYDKHHLVPFGEFIPFQNLIPLKPVAAFKGFTRGTGTKTIHHTPLPAFSPLVCYEVIFPDAVTKSSPRPDWMVNVTNDGWYGESAGPYQHFAQTRLRAIEEGLPLIRSANTGISAVIDPLGRVIEKADIFQEAALTTYLPRPLPDRFTFIRNGFQLLLPLVALGLLWRMRKTLS